MRKRYLVIGISLLALFSIVGYFTISAFTAVHVSASKDIISLNIGTSVSILPDTDIATVKFNSITKNAPSGTILTKYNDYILYNGSWRDEYTRIYSVEKNKYIIEISNYPRVFEDTELHVYQEDIEFEVTEADLNYYDEEGNRFYQERQSGKLFELGNVAIHYKGSSLPGAFPKWIEYKETKLLSSLNSLEFAINNLPGGYYLESGVILYNDSNMVSLSGREINLISIGYNSNKQKLILDRPIGLCILYIEVETL